MGFELIIYEPLIDDNSFMGCRIERNIDNFKEKSSLIVANRLDDNLFDVSDKVYTRDIFGEN